LSEIIKNNRITALLFRVISFMLSLFGVLDVIGVFSGHVAPNLLLYYTVQSNILVIIMFAILIICSAKDIKESGIHGPSSYCERPTAIIMLAITVTMLVFWVVLAPFMSVAPEMGMNVFSLWSFQNLQPHLITPLLIIIDYFVFEKPGTLTRRDPWIFAAIPLSYLIQATILGFSGANYGVAGFEQHFPYFFMDYYVLGWKVAIYVVVILIFFLALAYGLIWFDKKRLKSKNNDTVSEAK
jgi:hypothetical protein